MTNGLERPIQLGLFGRSLNREVMRHHPIEHGGDDNLRLIIGLVINDALPELDQPWEHFRLERERVDRDLHDAAPIVAGDEGYGTVFKASDVSLLLDLPVVAVKDCLFGSPGV